MVAVNPARLPGESGMSGEQGGIYSFLLDSQKLVVLGGGGIPRRGKYRFGQRFPGASFALSCLPVFNLLCFWEII